jgi:hypothetical protein
MFWKRAKSRAALLLAGAALVAIAIGSVAIASVATDSKAKTVKLKCPPAVAGGKKVSCRVIGKLPKGPKGSKGATGEPGSPGAAGPPGTSGYEVVSETFKEVFIQNSGGMRGLSEVKSASCPAGKRVLGGGGDLGTNATQNGQQRQVVVSASVPNGTGTAWNVQLFNNSTSIDTSIDLRVYAICADVG